MPEAVNDRPTSEFRIGQGVDFHRFEAGRPLKIGGVTIPHDRGLLGHSDADALLHALIDALLGAAGLSDIGTFFPDTDTTWKDADSITLLSLAWTKVRERGWRVVNFDATVLTEAPRLQAYIPEMKERIAPVLGIRIDACGIKAGTTEQIGGIGRGEGLAAQVVVLLERLRPTAG